jgi:hypothetical protein
VVTVTSTIPAEPAGDVAVRLVAELYVTPVPALEPNLTVAVLVNPVPVIVTTVPPPDVPVAGDTSVTVGAATYVNWSAGTVALVPPIVVTLTSTTPGEPAGEVAVICESSVTLKLAAAAPPNETADAPVK